MTEQNFDRQLTIWVKDKVEVQFAIDQLEEYNAPYKVVEGKSGFPKGKFAVFVPEIKEKKEYLKTHHFGGN